MPPRPPSPGHPPSPDGPALAVWSPASAEPLSRAPPPITVSAPLRRGVPLDDTAAIADPAPNDVGAVYVFTPNCRMWVQAVRWAEDGTPVFSAPAPAGPDVSTAPE